MNPVQAARQVVAETPLMPCPFCGGAAKLEESGDNDGRETIACSVVCCEKCFATGQAFSDRIYQKHVRDLNAVSAWNLRIKP